MLRRRKKKTIRAGRRPNWSEKLQYLALRLKKPEMGSRWRRIHRKRQQSLRVKQRVRQAAKEQIRSQRNKRKVYSIRYPVLSKAKPFLLQRYLKIQYRRQTFYPPLPFKHRLLLQRTCRPPSWETKKVFSNNSDLKGLCLLRRAIHLCLRHFRSFKSPTNENPKRRLQISRSLAEVSPFPPQKNAPSLSCEAIRSLLQAQQPESLVRFRPRVLLWLGTDHAQEWTTETSFGTHQGDEQSISLNQIRTIWELSDPWMRLNSNRYHETAPSQEKSPGR